jgi:hypothetical protein
MNVLMVAVGISLLSPQTFDEERFDRLTCNTFSAISLPLRGHGFHERSGFFDDQTGSAKSIRSSGSLPDYRPSKFERLLFPVHGFKAVSKPNSVSTRPLQSNIQLNDVG